MRDELSEELAELTKRLGLMNSTSRRPTNEEQLPAPDSGIDGEAEVELWWNEAANRFGPNSEATQCIGLVARLLVERLPDMVAEIVTQQREQLPFVSAEGGESSASNLRQGTDLEHKKSDGSAQKSTGEQEKIETRVIPDPIRVNPQGRKFLGVSKHARAHPASPPEQIVSEIKTPGVEDHKPQTLPKEQEQDPRAQEKSISRPSGKADDGAEKAANDEDEIPEGYDDEKEMAFKESSLVMLMQQAYEQALQGLDLVTADGLSELRYKNPHINDIGALVAAMCILLGEKPDWETGTRLLSRAKSLLHRLHNFDYNSVTPSMLSKLMALLREVPFHVSVTKDKTETGLRIWCLSVEAFARASGVGSSKQTIKRSNKQTAKRDAAPAARTSVTQPTARTSIAANDAPPMRVTMHGRPLSAPPTRAMADTYTYGKERIAPRPASAGAVRSKVAGTRPVGGSKTTRRQDKFGVTVVPGSGLLKGRTGGFSPEEKPYSPPRSPGKQARDVKKRGTRQAEHKKKAASGLADPTAWKWLDLDPPTTAMMGADVNGAAGYRRIDPKAAPRRFKNRHM